MDKPYKSLKTSPSEIELGEEFPQYRFGKVANFNHIAVVWFHRHLEAKIPCWNWIGSSGARESGNFWPAVTPTFCLLTSPKLLSKSSRLKFILNHCTQDERKNLTSFFKSFATPAKTWQKLLIRDMLLVKLIFRCHKSGLYSHSGLFWLAGPTVPVTPHYLSDNAQRNAPLNNDELIFFDIFAVVNIEHCSEDICKISVQWLSVYHNMFGMDCILCVIASPTWVEHKKIPNWN